MRRKQHPEAGNQMYSAICPAACQDSFYFAVSRSEWRFGGRMRAREVGDLRCRQHTDTGEANICNQQIISCDGDII
jgi:hypothetical protein